jgi:hypothetical protein
MSETIIGAIIGGCAIIIGAIIAAISTKSNKGNSIKARDISNSPINQGDNNTFNDLKKEDK